MCIDQKEMALSDKHCQIRNKPHDTAPCGQVLPLCTTDYNTDKNKIIDSNVIIPKNLIHLFNQIETHSAHTHTSTKIEKKKQLNYLKGTS